MITKTETEVSGAVGANAGTLSSKIQGLNKLSEEEKTKVKQRGQQIVDSVQMSEVTGLLEMLDDFVEFHQKKYYIVLDKLDEKWVGNDIRYKLIKSLIETVRDLNRLSNIKPIIALRQDLLNRVFQLTQDTGFQQEKYNPLYLDIKWSKGQLIELVNLRINHLFSSRYSKRTKLTYLDILPPTINNVETIDYILSRTLMRPRDVIEFINTCIKEVAIDSGVIQEEDVINAEVKYSNNRLDSLVYEWFTDYPGLRRWFTVLRKKNEVFEFSTVDNEKLLAKAMDYVENPAPTEHYSEDIIYKMSVELSNNKIKLETFKEQLIYAYYKLSLIGLKLKGERTFKWYQLGDTSLNWEDIEDDTEITIHPCYKSALKTVVDYLPK